jgi:hypothetical protein
LVHIPAGKICLVYFALNMLSRLFFGESTCICARSCLFCALGSERATLYIDVLDLTENFLGERALCTEKKKDSCYLSQMIRRTKYVGAINLYLPFVMICGSSRSKLCWPTFHVLFSFWGKGWR